MKYNIHGKSSIKEIESNEEELMEYLSLSLSNDKDWPNWHWPTVLDIDVEGVEAVWS